VINPPSYSAPDLSDGEAREYGARIGEMRAAVGQRGFEFSVTQ
jgi:hypothetical protein